MATLETIDSALEARLAANQRMQQELEEMEARIIAFLQENDVKLFPGVEQESCQCVPEHFVATNSMDGHLEKCHGIERREDLSHEFFYEKFPAVENIRQKEHSIAVEIDSIHSKNGELLNDTPATYEEGTTDTSFIEVDPEEQEHSIVDQTPTDGDTFYGGIQLLGSNLQDLQVAITSWTSIPRIFSKLDMMPLKMDGIRTWIKEWLRTHVKNSINDDLVSYIIHLLEHPVFNVADIVVNELHEFLGVKTQDFVLSLWKQVVFVIAMETFYKSIPLPPGICLMNPPAQSKSQDTRKNASHQLDLPTPIKKSKRRDRTKRKSASETMREIITNQMEALKQIDHWDIILVADEEKVKSPQINYEEERRKRHRRENLMRISNPLDVRDLDRPRPPKRKRSQSRDGSRRSYDKKRRSQDRRSRERISYRR